MAARRLLIVLLVLFSVSIFAASLAPDRDDEKQTTSQATTATTTAASAPLAADGPRALKIDADRKPIDVLPLQAGDQISLDVTSKTADSVEIPAFGLIEAVDPVTPAHFELLLEQPGSFAIRLVGAGRLAGRLQVSRATPPAPASGKSPPSP